LRQPQDVSVVEGAPIAFSIGVSEGNFAFDWRKGGEVSRGVPIPFDFSPPPTFWKPGKTIGKTVSGTFEIKAASLADNGAYDVVVTGDDGVIYSNQFNVYVRSLPPSAPAITALTGNTSVIAASPLTLSIIATGSPFPAIKWQKNGVDLVGATGSGLSISNAQLSDSGTYRAVLSNSSGTVASQGVTVTVSPIPSRLVNLSVLANAPTSGTFTVGAVIVGGASGSSGLLVRAIGPGLSQFGVTNPLADPRLTLFRGQSVVQSNDNWGGAVSLSTTFSQLGAFSLSDRLSKDAVVLAGGLAPGAYTVEVGAPSGSSGIVLAEMYDLNASGPVSVSSPRLVNLSCLKQVEPRDILTVGFVISGATTKKVLVRAVGPTLGFAPFNIPGSMADPKLEMYRGQTVVASNDNWGSPVGVGAATKVELSSVFAQVGAFPLPDLSRDASIVALLNPGNYTVQISGGNFSGGIAIVEVYEVP